jgi:uncharacterized protein YndB with AHSA1/START domain
MTQNSIEREIVIQAPPERVWAALTEAEHMGRWFGDAGAQVELRPGGAIVCSWREHGTAHAVVERVEPPRYFSFRWALPAGEKPRRGNSTLVEFTLEPRGDGSTRLRVHESGFRDLDGTEEERARHVEDNTGGWKSELAELREYVERQPA